jgi:acyl-CoA dehydrogenase
VVKGGRNLEREELSDDLLAQIFDVFIRDLSGFALQLFGKPSSTPAQMALCQRMIRKPAPDAARAERVFVEHVLSQKDAYEMRP